MNIKNFLIGFSVMIIIIIAYFTAEIKFNNVPLGYFIITFVTGMCFMFMIILFYEIYYIPKKFKEMIKEKGIN